MKNAIKLGDLLMIEKMTSKDYFLILLQVLRCKYFDYLFRQPLQRQGLQLSGNFQPNIPIRQYPPNQRLRDYRGLRTKLTHKVPQGLRGLHVY